MITEQKKTQTILIAILFLFVSTGCVSLNSHQSGRTVGKDNISTFANFNVGRINSEQYFSIKDSGVFTILEVGEYGGVTENFDAGVKVNSSFHCTGMSKYQFLGNKSSLIASSIGLDFGAGPLGLMMGVISYSGSLSLYNSIHPTDYLAFTLSPRYNYLGFTNLTKEHGFTRQNNIYGYSGGIIIGRKYQISFELSQYVNNAKFSFNTKPIISLGFIISN